MVAKTLRLNFLNSLVNSHHFSGFRCTKSRRRSTSQGNNFGHLTCKLWPLCLKKS